MFLFLQIRTRFFIFTVWGNSILRLHSCKSKFLRKNISLRINQKKCVHFRCCIVYNVYFISKSYITTTREESTQFLFDFRVLNLAPIAKREYRNTFNYSHNHNWFRFLRLWMNKVSVSWAVIELMNYVLYILKTHSTNSIL